MIEAIDGPLFWMMIGSFLTVQIARGRPSEVAVGIAAGRPTPSGSLPRLRQDRHIIPLFSLRVAPSLSQ